MYVVESPATSGKIFLFLISKLWDLTTSCIDFHIEQQQPSYVLVRRSSMVFDIAVIQSSSPLSPRSSTNYVYREG